MTDDQRLEMLDAIQHDPKATAAELATRLGLEAAEVAAEVARLEAEGVIKTYRAIIDWDKVGGRLIYAFVDVRRAAGRRLRVRRHSAAPWRCSTRCTRST